MCGENGRHGREGSSQNPLTCATSQRGLRCGLQQCWFDIELKSGFYVGVLAKYSMRAAEANYILISNSSKSVLCAFRAVTVGV